MTQQIAIDGPAGCGKSTLGKVLAKELGYIFLDSGVLYRMVAREALDAGISLDDSFRLTAIAERLLVYITPNFIKINHKKLRHDLQDFDVDVAVPFVAAYPTVRTHIRRIQQELASRHDIVMVGRDVGRTVLPQAQHKFFLSVAMEERVERAYARSNGVLLREFIRASLEWRDYLDRTRATSPMQAADGAILVQTDGYDVPQSVAALRAHLTNNPPDTR